MIGAARLPHAHHWSRWLLRTATLALVLLWVIPTIGLLVTSLRDRDAIATSGWWTALAPSENVIRYRAPSPEQATEVDAQWILRGNLFGAAEGRVLAFGLSAADPRATPAGNMLLHRHGHSVQVAPNGDFTVTYPQPPQIKRGQRIYAATLRPPDLSLRNYQRVLLAEGMGRSFLNTLTVTLPATLLPVLIAAFAAYALAWMPMRGRALLVALIAALLVVPLQLTFIPLLRLYNEIGLGKGYLGIWLAHTGFGLPIAVFLLHNAMKALPRDMIDSARMDGASELRIFRTIVLPLSFPALASLAVLQFLWVWNDLLVARVFLGASDTQLVMTGRMIELMGSHGGEWEVLAASAFVSLALPLAVFFALQRFVLRGLLAGAVKGG